MLALELEYALVLEMMRSLRFVRERTELIMFTLPDLCLMKEGRTNVVSS